MCHSIEWKVCLTKNTHLIRVCSLCLTLSVVMSAFMSGAHRCENNDFMLTSIEFTATSLRHRDLCSLSYRTPVTTKFERITASQLIALSHHIYRRTLYTEGKSYLSRYWIHILDKQFWSVGNWVHFLFNLKVFAIFWAKFDR